LFWGLKLRTAKVSDTLEASIPASIRYAALGYLTRANFSITNKVHACKRVLLSNSII